MKVVAFGEIMLRLSTSKEKKLNNSNFFNINYGGAEANFLSSIANFGLKADFVSVLPQNELGFGALKQIKQASINTENIMLDNTNNSRLGIYFLETGSSIRASKVVYDRLNSSFANINPALIDYEKILKDTDLFHFTGITPALSENCVAVLKNFLKLAKEKGVKISCDLNYRKKLWSKKQSTIVMNDLLKYVDICIGNEEDFFNMCDIEYKSINVEKGYLDISEYASIFEQLVKRYNFKYVLSTLRESVNASYNRWSAVGYDGIKFNQSKKYDIQNIVDRVGSGDAFSGGFVYKILETKNFFEALEFGVANAALKHTVEGDFSLSLKEDVESLLKKGGNGRIER